MVRLVPRMDSFIVTRTGELLEKYYCSGENQRGFQNKNEAVPSHYPEIRATHICSSSI
jgi:hypothetical protein